MERDGKGMKRGRKNKKAIQEVTADIDYQHNHFIDNILQTNTIPNKAIPNKAIPNKAIPNKAIPNGTHLQKSLWPMGLTHSSQEHSPEG